MGGSTLKRSILLSLLVIAAAATFLGVGTFATFIASDSDSGVLKSASLSIDVQGTGTSLAFSGSGGRCPDQLLPGDSCSDTVTVKNTSSINVTIVNVLVTESGLLETCGDGNSLNTVTAPNIVGVTLAPNATTNFTITTTLEATANFSCMNKTATVAVIVAAQE